MKLVIVNINLEDVKTYVISIMAMIKIYYIIVEKSISATEYVPIKQMQEIAKEKIVF